VVTLEVDVVADVALQSWLPEKLSALLAAASAWEPSAPTGAWQLTLRITDDAEISALHERFFGDASPTDVISFPSGDELTAPTGYLGDIIVSFDTARLNAVDMGHPPERELAFLALHGLLHVCGYSDTSPAERTAMLARQTELLERFEREHDRRW
jgi:probable rRNA maturation factor